VVGGAVLGGLVGAGLVVAVWFVVSGIQRKSADPAAARLAAGEAELSRQTAELIARRELLDSSRERIDRETQSWERVRSAAQSELDGIRAELRELRLDLERRDERVSSRERRLDSEISRIGEREQILSAAESALALREVDLVRLEAERSAALERIAGMTREEARADLVGAIESEAKLAAAVQVRGIERTAKEQADQLAREIVTGAVQRVASDQTAEATVTVLHLPADDMKGRIIGREGRNIRAFEAVTGVNLIIDDTPEAVVLSCFDPMRREIGRLTLDSLVKDGRIHPQRIEEAYERSKTEIDRVAMRAAEDALIEVGISDLDPELIAVLAKLRFRTSYGQNVLAHLVETAHLAGAMAAELGLPIDLMRRCGFLHDIGKALTHEVEGSHAVVGAELARRYGESPDVVHAIEAHHNEVEVRTLEAVLTQAADAISGSRPGARRESLESYVKRLRRLEEIASDHDAVDRVFAMQAGREIRVMVLPEKVDDIGAQILARDIAKRVEEELTYPGQIRITVVRESRATELAR
jgi:ribonucrease Y